MPDTTFETTDLAKMQCLYVQKTYPAAQFPLEVPPLLAHSLAVKQVPLRTVLKKKLLFIIC